VQYVGETNSLAAPFLDPDGVEGGAQLPDEYVSFYLLAANVFIHESKVWRGADGANPATFVTPLRRAGLPPPGCG